MPADPAEFSWPGPEAIQVGSVVLSAIPAGLAAAGMPAELPDAFPKDLPVVTDQHSSSVKLSAPVEDDKHLELAVSVWAGSSLRGVLNAASFFLLRIVARRLR
jgi:hypothetical protein